MTEYQRQQLSDALNSLFQQTDTFSTETVLELLDRDEEEYQDALRWIFEQQKTCDAIVTQVDFNKCLGKWIINETSGDIYHESGGFFQIIGVDVQTNKRESGIGWCQPMMDQGTESSIAGVIRQKQDGVFRYLVEAKFEPGNYNRVLISPSLQVTYSNLNQLHKGKRPLFAEYFDGSRQDVKVLYEHWLPEDGGRFYKKRVKYMLVNVSEQEVFDVGDNFRWVRLSTLKQLLHQDNLINPHVRSILAIF